MNFPPPEPELTPLQVEFMRAAGMSERGSAEKFDAERLAAILQEHPEAVTWDVPWCRQTALFYVVSSKSSAREESARLLLDRGVEVDARSTHGETPLMRAASWNNAACVRLLLARGADIDARDRRGETALALAAERQAWEAAEALIACGASLEMRDGGTLDTCYLALESIIKKHKEFQTWADEGCATARPVKAMKRIVLK